MSDKEMVTYRVSLLARVVVNVTTETDTPLSDVFALAHENAMEIIESENEDGFDLSLPDPINGLRAKLYLDDEVYDALGHNAGDDDSPAIAFFISSSYQEGDDESL